MLLARTDVVGSLLRPAFLLEAREQLATQARESDDVRAMLEFIDRSERALAR